MKSRGNINYNEEWQFWLVTMLQFVVIILIPAGIQNLVAYFKERK